MSQSPDSGAARAKGCGVALQNVTLGYDGHPAVHHLSGDFPAGSMTAICGPNGAGKSTLARALAGALKPIGGAILREGLPARAIAYLPQAAEIDRTFPMDVFDMVVSGARVGLFGALGARVRESAERALAAVGLQGFERRPIGALSGGQTQRMLFARLMMQDARFLVLDEPFAAVDERTTADLTALLERWRGEGRTIVAVLHDLAEVRAHFRRTLLLARECVAWGPTSDVLTADNLARARRMSEAFDESAAACERAA
ncbi:MAG: metal ABC transporter ATP-binding protein [Hyphomicrobiales bacterium]|nr:metal ABC transporter ATP-binding protein [Hyphomicrobiales bacterium]